ncbi:MAG TPA: hypothetical protein VGV10_01290, partial [Thermoleophilaceae bacterium]|nr:hypothetical protein [Thermoleophilaceae bacterium]
MLGTIGAIVVLVSAVSLAWACVPQGSFRLSPTTGPAGSTVTAVGSGFPPGHDVKMTWGSPTGPELARGAGPAFQQPITIPPDAAPGTHMVVAVSTLPEHGIHTQTAAAFTVPGGSTTPPPGETPPGTAPPTTPPPGSDGFGNPVAPLVPGPGQGVR